MTVVLDLLGVASAVVFGVILVALPWRIAAVMLWMNDLSRGRRSYDWFLGRDGARDFFHWCIRLFGIAWLLLLFALLVSGLSQASVSSR